MESQTMKLTVLSYGLTEYSFAANTLLAAFSMAALAHMKRGEVMLTPLTVALAPFAIVPVSSQTKIKSIGFP